MVKNFEKSQNGVKRRRSPNKTRVVLDLIVRNGGLIILNFLVDVVQFQVEFVDHLLVGEVISSFGRLTPRNVNPVQYLVNRITAVHFYQILIDRVKFCIFGKF